jgi:hypothetical protein
MTDLRIVLALATLSMAVPCAPADISAERVAPGEGRATMPASLDVAGLLAAYSSAESLASREAVLRTLNRVRDDRIVEINLDRLTSPTVARAREAAEYLALAYCGTIQAQGVDFVSEDGYVYFPELIGGRADLLGDQQIGPARLEEIRAALESKRRELEGRQDPPGMSFALYLDTALREMDAYDAARRRYVPHGFITAPQASAEHG